MGHVYQSRFKNFMIQSDEHLLWVLRYVERNPLRAGLVKRAEHWPWSSLRVREHGADEMRELLSAWPIDMPADWVRQVNRAQTTAEEQAILRSIKRGTPLGDEDWVERMVKRYDLKSTVRPRGRQKGWRKVK
jgi:putative transposase